MAYVKCQVSEGLRPSEATVGVSGLDGSTAYLRVERYFLEQFGSDCYLPVGVVYQGKDEGGPILIELPHEADSGANRVWVAAENVRFEREGALA
jgi:hypothetical protein